MQPSLHESPGRRTARRVLAGLFLVVVAVIASFFVRESLEIEWTAESIRAAVEQAGFWGPLIFLAMMTFRFAVLIPSPILLSAAGVCFGMVAGTLYGGLGLLLSALLKYAMAKLLGHELLLAQLPPSTRQRLSVANSRLGVGALGAVSGYPIGPAGIIHVGAILSGMRLIPFTVAVGGGSLLRAATFSYFGNALTEGEGLVLATLVLVAVAVIPLAVPSWRAWIVNQIRTRA